MARQLDLDVDGRIPANAARAPNPPIGSALPTVRSDRANLTFDGFFLEGGFLF